MNFVYLCAPPGYCVYRYWKMTGRRGHYIKCETSERFYSCSLPEAYRKAWSMWFKSVLRAFSVELRYGESEINRYHHRELLVGRAMLRYCTATEGDYYVLYAVEGDAPIWSGDDVDEALARFTLLVQAIEGPRHAMHQESMMQTGHQNYTMQLLVSRERKKAAKSAEETEALRVELERSRQMTDNLKDCIQDLNCMLAPNNILGRLVDLEERVQDIVDQLGATSGDAGKEET